MTTPLAIPAAALTHRTFSVRDRVFLYMLSLGDEWSYTSNAVLAEKVGSTLMQATAAKKVLVREGLLIKQKHPEKTGHYFQHKACL